jgi:hypothetical protein
VGKLWKTYKIQHGNSDYHICSESTPEPNNRSLIEDVELCNVLEPRNLLRRFSVYLISM